MDGRGSRFNPHAYSDVPLYNIQAVAEATGVPAITLRSWERRYGVPRPKRDPKGYRLYSDRDIALTGWLKDRVQHGVGISRAVNMLRLLEQGEPVLPQTQTFGLETLRDQLLEAVKRLDEPAVRRVIAEGLMVAPVEQVCLDVLQPVLYEVGRQWSAGEITVTMEHVGSNLIRSQVTQLVQISPAPLRPERVVVGCAPGELHDIGALMLSLFLRRRGFDVVYAGASVEPRDFVNDVTKLRPAAVCLSATLPETAQTLRQLFLDLLREYDCLLFHGGRVFNNSPEIRSSTPGIYGGIDAAATARTIEEHLRGGLELADTVGS